MKTGKDFREAFPPMDEGFRRAVLHALDETGKERMMVKRKIRVSVVIAAVIVLLAAVALAATGGQWGIMDFMNRKDHFWGNYRQTNGNAARIVETTENPVSVTDGVAVYTVEQSACDGVYIYLTVRARPVKENVLLLGGTALPEFGASVLNREGLGDDLTIAAYAEREGLDIFFIYCQGAKCFDMTLNEDGSSTLVMYSEVSSVDDSNYPTVQLCATPISIEPFSSEWDAYLMRYMTRLDYTVSRREVTEKYISTDRSDFDGLFPTACTVDVLRTEFTNYAVIRWPDPISGDEFFYRFTLHGGNDDAESGIVGWNENLSDQSQIICFTADTIGDTLTVALERHHFGEWEDVPTDDGDVIRVWEVLGVDTAQHTFHLIRVEEN